MKFAEMVVVRDAGDDMVWSTGTDLPGAASLKNMHKTGMAEVDYRQQEA